MTESAEGVAIFYIDIIDAMNRWDKSYQVKNVVVTADGVAVLVDMTKLKTGDLEDNGNFRIQLFNEYDENNTPAISTGITFNQNLTVTFELEEDTRIQIVDKNVELEYTSVVYDGTAKKPGVTVKIGDKTLTKDTDYEVVSYADNTNAGAATVTVTGKGSYKGTVTKTFNILQPGNAYLCYSDGDWYPGVSLASSNLATAAVNGAGTYTLSWDTTETADGAMLLYVDIIGASTQWEEAGKSYDVTAVTLTAGGQSIPVTLSKVQSGDLEGNGNFRIELYNEYGPTKSDPAIDAASLNFTGNMTLTFTLTEDNRTQIGADKVKLDYDYVVYDGAAKKPGVTVEVGGKTLTAGTDYTVEYADNTNVGTATVTVTGKGNYKGTVTKTFSILKSGNAYLCFSDGDWYPGVSLGSSDLVTTAVNGAGTYTLSWDLNGNTAEGVMVYYIDIIGSGKSLDGYGVTAMTISVDGKNIPVDISKLVVGDLEGNGNYRIEIYNSYGDTKNASPIDISGLTFGENMTVKFTLTEGAADSNASSEAAQVVPGNAYLCYSDADWYPGVSLESDPLVSTPINGNGTYTLSWDLQEWETAEGIMVFYIDVIGAGSTLNGYGVTDMKLTIDGKSVPVNVSKLNVGDLEGNGNFRIEIYNNWGSTKTDCPFDVSVLNSVIENVTVQFTLEAGKASVNNQGASTVPGQGSSSMWYWGSDYTAKMQYSDADWYPGVEVNGRVDASGTYTFWWDLADWEDASGINVFYIDILGAANETHLTSLKIYADGVEIPVDMDKILTGDLEGKGNYRIEIFNIYGSTAVDSPINQWLSIYENLRVVFTLEEGPDPEDEFTGEGFKATLVFNDADWWPQTSITTGVTGPGTYTLSWDLPEGEIAEGVITFYIDIFDAFKALSGLELTELIIMVDGEPISVDMSKVLVGDLEGYGHYRIEIFNEYGSTKLDPPIDTDLLIGKNLTVTFTLAEPVEEEAEEAGEEVEAIAAAAEETSGSGIVWTLLGIVLLLLIVFIIIVLLRRRKKEESQQAVSE